MRQSLILCLFQSQVMSTLSSPSSQYLVQSILKEGSYEKLTKCVNIATRKTVYLKILNSRSALPEKEKELLILKHLRKFDPDNFNIVRCNSVFFKAEKIFIEYEMLGQTLFDFVKDRPSHCMTLNEIRPILHQVATTLQLLRRLGIVHTNLKTDNIMLVNHANQPFRIKVFDFGSALFSTSEWAEGIAPLPYR
uniref:Protein kinase domain-containing protein n=1 Tax=Scophthalmus maximus TaxID=52904 RepID=A0A8D3CML4_SCOMX